MKNTGILIALLISACALQAQVTVEVHTDQDQFLAKETMPVAVRIVNHSGQTLHLGAEPDWLTFSIESREGFVVTQSADVPVVLPFDLDSAKVATKRVDLAPYFNLKRLGGYTITAKIRFNEWKTTIKSDPKPIEIVSGTRIWEQEFGLPQTVANQKEPEVRKYILQQATYAKKMKLYMRLTDMTETEIYKVVQIGPWISFSHPDARVDKVCNLHVIYQTNARLYSYTKLSPQGEVLAHQFFDFADRRPRLALTDTGEVFVSGGQRHFSPDDVPASAAQVSSNDVKTPQP